MPLEVRYVFEEVPGGTRLTVTMDTQPAGFFRTVGPIFVIALKRQIRKDLEILRTLLASERRMRFALKEDSR